MDLCQQLLIILICGIVTVLIRATPFILFKDGDHLRPSITYLGYALPAALFAMLVVYCLKDVEFTGGTYGVPELISIVFVVLIHLKWRNMILSLVGGTAFYIVLGYLLETMF